LARARSLAAKGVVRVTGQHLLLLLWTSWIVFALLSIGDLLGVILALVFGLLSLGLIATGLATWRGYVIAWLMVHVLVAAYRVTVLRGWPPQEARARGQGDRSSAQQPNPVRLRLLRLSAWTQSPRLQAIFGSVSLIGLASVLYLRPTVPWKYRVDIPLMILLVCVIVVAEYVLLPVSWRVKRHQKGQQPPEDQPRLALSASESVLVEGKVVGRRRRQPADTQTTNSERIDGLTFRLPNVETFLQQQVRDALAHSAFENDPPACFHGSDEPITGVFSVELLRIARLTMRQEGSNGISSRVVGITIERRTVPISPKPGEKVNQVMTRAAKTRNHEIKTRAAAPVTAQPISPPGWEVVSARWAHVGLADGNTAARTAADLGAGLDSILRKETVRPVFSWKAPGSAASVIGKVAENKETLQVGGIVVGTRSGRPVAVSACFWSLARDDFTRSLAAGIARELGKIGLSRTPRPSSMHRQPTRAPVG
jgi:hypothetical protein